MKMSNKNKFISGLLGVAMCPMMLPTAAFAADDRAASEDSSSPTELIQSSESEGTDTGARSGDTPAAQSELTGEAPNAMTSKAVNEEPASVAENAGEGTESGIAKVGGKNYSSLQEAINVAQDGETVTLLTDATEDAVINKSITLDLSGKTLTNTNVGKATISVQGGTVTVKNGNVVGGASYYNIEVTKGSNANMTLTDVAATAGNTGSSMIDNYGTLAITSGTYTDGLDTVKNEPNAKLTITGGTFTLTKGTSKGFTGVVFNYGDLTISGGEFTQSDKSAPYGYAQVIYTDKSGSTVPSTVISGGTFKNLCTRSTAWAVRATNAADGATKVSGGAFNKSVKDYYCAEGFIPTSTKDADGNYGVKEGSYVAQIGSKKYETLADAICLATKGKTIQLLTDATENITIASMKQITLDLNGHTLNGGTGTAKATILNKGTVTITDTSVGKTGTIKRDDQGIEGETSYYVIDNNGTMVIDQANVVNNSGAKGSSLIRNGGVDTVSSLTINGGTFEQQNFIAVKNDGNGELTIKGGTLTSKQAVVQNWNKAQILGGNLTGGYLWTDSYTEAGTVGETVIGGGAQFTGTIYMDVTSSNPSTLKIEGGKLDVTKWRVTDAAAAADATIAVSGGTFTNEVPADYCAAGYAPAANADGTYGVKQAVTVNFNSNQGSAVDSQLVTVGNKVVKPVDPIKKGYTFSGWFTDEDCTNAYDFDAAVDGTQPEFTLYAGWKAAPATVEPGAGDNGNNGDTDDNGNNGDNGDGSSVNANVNVNTVNNNGDNASSEAKMATVKTGDNLALVGGAIAVIAVAAAGVAVFALRRRKMN